MVLIHFRTPKNKCYKIDLQPTETVLQVKEQLSKTVGESIDPSKVTLLLKAKILKNDQTVDHLKIGDKDFIFAIIKSPKQKINYGENVVSFYSTENSETVRSAGIISSGNQQVDDAQRIFQRAIETEPRAFENIVEMYELAEPNIREHLNDLIQTLGIDTTGLNINLDEVRNRTAQRLDDNSFGLLLAQTCQELGINPLQFLNNLQRGARLGPAQGPEPGFSPPPPASQPQPQQQEQQQNDPIQSILSQFSQEEREAIHRLQQLGDFPLEYIIQIYVAADKNENLAANLLFGG